LPQVAIPHVIGTAILIGLIGVVALYSNNIYYNVFVDATKSELSDVASYVGSELISVYDLVSIEHGSKMVYKVLNIPVDVNGKGYSIRIVNVSGVLEVVAFLDENPNINGSSPLALSNETLFLHVGRVLVDGSNRITIVDRLFSGVSKPVIVVMRNSTSIYVGLGRLSVV